MDVFVPSGGSPDRAARRVALLGVGAHPDDLECMALEPIGRAYGTRTPGFAGIVLGDGAAGARGAAAEALIRTRRAEQRAAARRGRYALLLQFGHPSARVRDPTDPLPTRELAAVFARLRPREVFTHALSDRHPTHLATVLRVVEALRSLPPGARPRRLLGCEVWGGLDWMEGAGRVALPLRGPAGLGGALLRSFPSQLAQRPYDRGVAGRAAANAAFGPGRLPASGGLVLAMDLGPLLEPGGPSPEALLRRHLEAFRSQALGRLRAARGGG